MGKERIAELRESLGQWSYLTLEEGYEVLDALEAALARAENSSQCSITADLLEQLAALEHTRWAEVAKKALYEMDDARRERWSQQVATPYEDLSDPGKEQDRDQVRRYLAIIPLISAEPRP